MKPNEFGKNIFLAALSLFIIISNAYAQLPDCIDFRRTGNAGYCCAQTGTNSNGEVICIDTNYIGIPGLKGNLEIEESILITNDGTTNVYGETDILTGGGLGDSNNIKAAIFGWKPITDTEFGRWGFNGYTNWTSPAVLIKSQYTGTNSDVMALKVISKYATGKGVGIDVSGGTKGINVTNDAANTPANT